MISFYVFFNAEYAGPHVRPFFKEKIAVIRPFFKEKID